MKVFNGDEEFKNIAWKETNDDDVRFESIHAVPGYNTTTKPFCIAVTEDTSKIVLVNTTTR